MKKILIIICFLITISFNSFAILNVEFERHDASDNSGLQNLEELILFSDNKVKQRKHAFLSIENKFVVGRLLLTGTGSSGITVNSITITNMEGNSAQPFSNSGIVKVELYKSNPVNTGNILAATPILLVGTNISENESEITMSGLSSTVTLNGTTQPSYNIFVVYEFDKIFTSLAKKVGSKVKQTGGIDYLEGSINRTDVQGTLSIGSIDMVALKLSTSNISSKIDDFVTLVNPAKNMDMIPMGSFTLEAINSDFFVNTINIKSTVGNLDKVKNIYVFADDGDSTFQNNGTDVEVPFDQKINNLFQFVATQSVVESALEASIFNINEDKSKTFFVFYDLGDFGSNETVNFMPDRIEAIYPGDENQYNPGSGSSTSNIIISGDFADTPDTKTKITIMVPDFKINSIQQLSFDSLRNKIASNPESVVTTNKLVAGMYNLSYYLLDVNVEKNLSSVSMRLKSDFFSEVNNGISKVSLYIDRGVTFNVDAQDVLLSSTSTFGNEEGILNNISLPKGVSKLLLTIDLGQRIGLVDTPPIHGKVKFQIKDITIDSVTANVAMVSPFPISPIGHTVDKHQVYLNQIKIVKPDGITTFNESDEFNINPVEINTLLNSPYDIKLITSNANQDLPMSSPKFYYNSISGTDNTHEFIISLNNNTNLDSDINNWRKIFSNGVTPIRRELNYTVSTNILNNGNYIIDYDVYYQINYNNSGNELINPPYLKHPIRLTRAKGAGTDFFSVLDLSKLIETTETNVSTKINVATSKRAYSWTIPEYISEITVEKGDVFEPFENYHSIPQNAKMKIEFENGNDISPSSVTLTLNGNKIKSESEVTSSEDNYYEYDIDSGKITIQSIGEISGQISLTASDSVGNPLTTAEIIFFVSKELEINRFYVYPNPYSPTAGDSMFYYGASLTQPATIKVFVYDARGRLLNTLPEVDVPVTGYGSGSIKSEDIQENGKYLAAGTYYLKLVATGSDGKRVFATTKLAVF